MVDAVRTPLNSLEQTGFDCGMQVMCWAGGRAEATTTERLDRR
jgi:hypothetical protein